MTSKKVNNELIKLFSALWLLSVGSFANTASTTTTNITGSQLLNLAGKQRMLSQRIAKDYLYIGKNISKTKANRQLKESMNSFLLAHRKLISSIQDEEIKNLLDFVGLSSKEFKDITSKKFNLDNAQLILDLSESMLEGSQYVVDSLQNSLSIKKSTIIDRSTKQRMLSQRIAKYYISYQSGIKDKNTVLLMKRTVNQFSKNLEILIKNPSNTPQITKKLEKVEKLWKIVSKFYNNIEKGGLPIIVFNTTDNITSKMDEVTKLYLINNK